MDHKSHLKIPNLVKAIIYPICLALSSCNISEMSDTEHLALAKEHHYNGDHNLSIIALKNALRKNPDNIEARRLLGETNLILGNGADAEKELRRTTELGIAKNAILLSLTEALQLQGKHQQILDEIDAPASMDAANRASLMSYRGDAWLAIKKPDKARSEYERALATDSGSSLARVGLARLYGTKRDFKKALQLVQEALITEPEEAKAWSVQAGLYKANGDNEKSEASYSKAIEFRRFNKIKQIDRTNRALVRIDMKNYGAAEKDIEILKNDVPDFFLTHYADGLLAFHRGKYHEAQTAFEKSLRLNSEYLRTFYFLGVTHLQQDHLSQAEHHLARFLGAFPNSVKARKTLALTKFRLNDVDGAREILNPIIKYLPDDAFSQNLMGKIDLASGNNQKGIDHLRIVVALKPDSAMAHLSLGQAMLAQGDVKHGIEEVERALEINPSLRKADTLLAVNHLKNGNYEKALKLAQRLRDKYPNSATPLVLMAGANIGSGNRLKAKELLRNALQIDPSDANTVRNLAQLAIAEREIDKAESLYRNFLVQDPGNIQGLVQLAKLEQEKGNTVAAVEQLKKGIAENPTLLAPRILLGDYYLRSRQPQKALSILREMRKPYSQSHTLWAVIGRAQLAADNPSIAAASFRKLVNLQPHSADAQFLLAEAYVENNQPKKARSALKKALLLNPKHASSKFVLARLLTLEDQHGQANKLVEELKEIYPKSPDLYGLEAWMALRRNQPQQALVVYEEARTQFPDNNFWPQRLAQVQGAMGDHQASFATLNQWLKVHPNDFHIQYIAANGYLLLNQLDEAQAAFSELHKKSPDNVLVLNNLAWLLRRTDTNSALKYAERARELAPNWVEPMDTLALILLEQGKTDRAVSLLRDAAGDAPTRTDITYDLALALARSGDKSASRQILNKLLDRNEPFAEKEAVHNLLNELRGN